MFSAVDNSGPRRRILFLGDRSFEFEEVSVESPGGRGVSIVERGLGLHRAVVVYGHDVHWLVTRLRTASQDPGDLRFLGRLNGGKRTLAVWVRGEEGGGSSFQLVVSTGQRREQIFIPVSDFGDGWDGVALVLEGFRLAFDGPRHGKITSYSAPSQRSSRGGVGEATTVRCTAELDWFRMLDRSLVGKVGQLGGKGLSFATMFDWVQRWWKVSGTVEVRPIGGQAFLFVFTSRKEAKLVLGWRWIVDGRDLLLEWWSPLALCSKDIWSPATSIWIRVLGLPLHLRGDAVYRVIGAQCGGYVEADETSVDLGVVRLRIRSSESIPSSVVVRWGSWKFFLPIWVEEGPSVELGLPATAGGATTGADKDGLDLAQSNRVNFCRFGVKEYLLRFGEDATVRAGRNYLGYTRSLGGQRKAKEGFAKTKLQTAGGGLRKIHLLIMGLQILF
ncbi:hypothetical protein LOK49_Contig68G00005 [Camellia lanceoleosa]|nr:hypothetical protein LOK49_Contig68G00005 [Camellia lanceoleosa]